MSEKLSVAMGMDDAKNNKARMKKLEEQFMATSTQDETPRKSVRKSKKSKAKKPVTYEDLKILTLRQQNQGQPMQSAMANLGLPSKSVAVGEEPPRPLPTEYQALLPEQETSMKLGIEQEEEVVEDDDDKKTKKKKKKKSEDEEKPLRLLGMPTVPTEMNLIEEAAKRKLESKMSFGRESKVEDEEVEDDDLSTETELEDQEELLRQQLEQTTARALRRRLSFHVRRRRSLRAAAMAGGVAQGRPPRGRPCYFTEGHVLDEEARDVNAEPTPYWMPPATDELCYRLVDAEWHRERREEKRKLPYWDHHTIRSRRSLDLLRRLHIPREVEDPTKLTPGILEIDPDYYSIVEGRPEYTATLGRDGILNYLEEIRNVLKTKLMIGYAQDHILMVNEQYTQELRIIRDIHQKNQKNVKAFEEFLAEDHQKSMEILQHADRMTTETHRLEGEMKSFNRQLGKLRCEVYVLEEHWRTVKMLQRFLYAASPAAWRMQHDHEFMQRVRESGSISSDEFLTEPVSTREVRSDMNLNELIALFNDEVDGEPPPELYFRSPKDLLDVFENITQLNMDMMTHAEQVRKPLDELYHTLNEARKRMDTETERMRIALAEQHARIDWERRRATELERDARRLLDEVFKDLIIDDEVIQTLVCVEDAHEACVAANDSNLTVMEMMRNIERKYESMMETLDMYSPNLVAQVERDVFLDEKVRMVRANVAAKQLVQIRRMEDRMHKALQTPPAAGMRPLVFRSPPFVKYVKRQKEVRKLSPEERNMLLHLTEWCPQTDNPEPYLEELRRTGMLDGK